MLGEEVVEPSLDITRCDRDATDCYRCLVWMLSRAFPTNHETWIETMGFSVEDLQQSKRHLPLLWLTCEVCHAKSGNVDLDSPRSLILPPEKKKEKTFQKIIVEIGVKEWTTPKLPNQDHSRL